MPPDHAGTALTEKPRAGTARDAQLPFVSRRADRYYRAGRNSRARCAGREIVYGQRLSNHEDARTLVRGSERCGPDGFVPSGVRFAPDGGSDRRRKTARLGRPKGRAREAGRGHAAAGPRGSASRAVRRITSAEGPRPYATMGRAPQTPRSLD